MNTMLSTNKQRRLFDMYSCTAACFQTELKELHKHDIESKDFDALPADIKHAILTELKDAGRKTDWACINSMPKVCCVAC